jgi:hypothetical protein
LFVVNRLLKFKCSTVAFLVLLFITLFFLTVIFIILLLTQLCSKSIKKLLRIARDRFRLSKYQSDLMAGNPLELMIESVIASNTSTDFVNRFYITMSLYFPSILNHITCVDASITCIIIDWK